MKLLTLEDYLSSANTEAAGLSPDIERQLILDVHSQMTAILTHFKMPPHIESLGMTIFHWYNRHIPFTEIDRGMVSAVCVTLACKIDYFHVRVEDFVKYYH